ncbi:hypothetical protein F9C11_21625 [Amycolatopsis sp. VS8301801F10]|uniref:hypothetical protein n=1 Tax=Amycolatopsis sp. VS8301801F10 TaxID=2652442 RepID=UPI0038FC8205
MPDQPGNASERPNAGQETAIRAAIAGEHHQMELSYALQQLKDATARADAAEAKLRDAEKIRFNVDRILDDALGPNVEDGAGMGLAGEVALLAERKKEAEDRLDQVRVVLLEGGQDAASVRREALAVVLGESDRIGHRGDHQRRAKLAEERLAQAIELCKEARAESAADRAKLEEICAAIEQCTLPVGALQEMSDAVNLVHPVSEEDDDTPYSELRARRAMEVVYGWLGTIRAVPRQIVERTTTESGQPSLAAADAWARECTDNEEALAAAQETAAAEAYAERSAYDMDPDIDEPEDEEDSRG